MSAVINRPAPESINTLALLALKVAPNVFDLSSGQYNVSIRDQIVRGQLLIRDLCKADPTFSRVLIVGAGVGGVAAAMAAAGLGKEVCLVETLAAPFSLQSRTNKRFVGPFMYEWPMHYFDNQSYPPNRAKRWPNTSVVSPRWKANKPMRSSDFARIISRWLKRIATKPPPGMKKPHLWFKVDRHEVKNFVKAFAGRTEENLSRKLLNRPLLPPEALKLQSGYLDWLTGKHLSNPTTFTPTYVILAAGMGKEETRLPPRSILWPRIKGLSFWQDDNLRDRKATDQQIAVFGGGDGALQDVLRALTRFEHPLQILSFLRKDRTVRLALDKAMNELQTLEGKYRFMDTWTLGNDVFKTFDADCKAYARKLATMRSVREKVFKAIRPGNGMVQHFMQSKHFTKAYLLNRFLVHLISECTKAMGQRWVGHMGYKCFPGSSAIMSRHDLRKRKLSFEVDIRMLNGKVKTRTFDQIAVRFGIEAHSSPAYQMVRLSPNDDGKRTSLAHIPLPYVVSD